MLELTIIFLITLVMAAIAVWLYRLASGWHGFKQTVVGRSNTKVRMTLRAQQGYISLTPPSRKPALGVKLGGSGNGIKAPWGW